MAKLNVPFDVGRNPGRLASLRWQSELTAAKVKTIGISEHIRVQSIDDKAATFFGRYDMPALKNLQVVRNHRNGHV